MGERGRARARFVTVAGALLSLAVAHPAWADTPGAGLALSAGQGPPSGAFAMTFTYAPLLALCPAGLAVTFTWDGAAHTLAQASLDGAGCSASATATPPAGLSAPGAHTVVATAGSQNASATYTILAVSTATPATRPSSRRTPARTPAPSHNPTAAPSPTPTPTATPGTKAAPTATTTAMSPPSACDTSVPQATGSTSYLQVAGVRGDATEPEHAGAVVIEAMSPASMLPPVIGTMPLTEAQLTRVADSATAALVQAVASGVHFDCVQLELGPTPQYLYVTYAFHDVLFSAYTPTAGSEQLTLNYVTVDWEYELRDGSRVHTGRGKLGDTPDPRPLQQPALPAIPVTLLGVLLLGGGAGGGLLWLRRSRNQAGGSPHR